ncbi:MAG: hypothetical protein AAFQ84_09915 [Pseudomonadota bacterium]
MTAVPWPSVRRRYARAAKAPQLANLSLKAVVYLKGMDAFADRLKRAGLLIGFVLLFAWPFVGLVVSRIISG